MSQKPKLIFKPSGKREEFKPQKLEQSIKQTFNMLKTPEGQADELAKITIRQFNQWHANKPEITSYDIQIQVSKILENISPNAAYIFKNLKSIM